MNAILQTLIDLYKKQLSVKPDWYLETHSRLTNSIKNRINSFNVYKSYIGRNVLDWGCRHAIDACLVRMMNEDSSISACDFCHESEYEVFYEYAQVQFTTIVHHYKLPYENDSFDSVIGAGVFEHVPFDDDTIKELWRITKVRGYLVLTYLPNKTSYTEIINSIFNKPHHRKRFSISEINNYLLHNGFLPVMSKYHQMIPTQLGGFQIKSNVVIQKMFEKLWFINGILERTWFLNRLSTNLIIVAQKVNTIP